MIHSFRHAVPWLQKLSSWPIYATPLPLARRYAGAAWTTATLVHSATDAESQHETTSVGPLGIAADSGAEKGKRRPLRGSTSSAAAGADKAVALEQVLTPDSAGGSGDEDSTSTTQLTASKRRTSKRRKAVVSSGDAPKEPSAAGATEPAASPAPKPTRRKKQEAQETPLPAAEAAEVVLSPGGEKDDTEARGSSNAGASSCSDTTGTTATIRKRASRSTSKKAATSAKASSDEEEAREGKRASIQSLPFEDCLVLPRKAEHILVALGLRPSHEVLHAGPGGISAGATVSPLAPGHGCSISNVLELASYLGRPDPKELAAPLLIAQYQGYLGPSPDYLYDLFYLDYDPPYLSNDAVRNAAVAAARFASRPSSLLSAKRTPPDELARAAMDRLRADVGEEAVAAQEVRAPRLAEAQLELFLLDWASARLAGPTGERGLNYVARRCAALQLTRPIVVERLHRYAVQGASLQELASTGGRNVRLSQPMDALIEGLKAGVRLDSERLLNDFRLTSPGAPLREHLQEVRRAVVQVAARTMEPGSAMYYNMLVDGLYFNTDMRAALEQQDAQWQKEHGERDGSMLTHAQVRLLFHLWRLERFRAEEQARRRRQAEAAETGGPP